MPPNHVVQKQRRLTKKIPQIKLTGWPCWKPQLGNSNSSLTKAMRDQRFRTSPMVTCLHRSSSTSLTQATPISLPNGKGARRRIHGQTRNCFPIDPAEWRKHSFLYFVSQNLGYCIAQNPLGTYRRPKNFTSPSQLLFEQVGLVTKAQLQAQRPSPLNSPPSKDHPKLKKYLPKPCRMALPYPKIIPSWNLATLPWWLHNLLLKLKN